MELSFTIPLRPVPKGRPRFGNGRTFTPKKTRDYEEAVGMIAKQYFKQPLEGDISISAVFYIKGRRGDCDNLTKSLLDSMNGIAWKDDHQIVEVYARIEKSSNERTEITVKTLDGLS